MLQNFVIFYVFRQDPRFKSDDGKQRLPTTNTIKTVLKTFYAIYAQVTKSQIDETMKDKTRMVKLTPRCHLFGCLQLFSM